MACVKKNCKIVADDCMISCWLCLGLCHLKCSGLRARDADALSDSSKNLQWTCPDCRPIGIEFYKFFKCYKSEFDDLKSDFLALKSKLEKFGDIFTNFSKLDSFSPPPGKNIATKKSASSSGNTSPSVSNSNNNSNKNHNKVPHNSAISSVNSVNPSQTNLTAVTNNTTTSTQKLTNTPLQLQINSAPDSVSLASDNQPSELIVFSPHPSNAEPNTNAVPNSKSSLNNKSSLLQCPSIIEPKPLRVIPPMKTIFATRFAPDTSVLDVEFYIKNNMKQDLYNNIEIFKINARNRASFKIIVPVDLFETLVNPKFWPENTIIKKFVYKDSDNVILPATESLSKN